MTFINSYVLYLTASDDRRTIHEALAKTFSFPDHYGRNLDALFDMLTEISAETHLTVLVKNLSAVANNSYLCSTFETLMWAADENPHFSCQIGDDPEPFLSPEDFFRPHCGNRQC